MHIERPSFASGNLEQAIQIANEMLDGKRGFFQEVKQIKSFDMSYNPLTHQPFSGEEIMKLMSQKIEVTLKTYRPWFIWSKATAYTDAGVPVIHLNAHKLDRSIPDLVGTLLHECVHVVDEALEFSHGSNYASGKSDTAPYRIGLLAKLFA